MVVCIRSVPLERSAKQEIQKLQLVDWWNQLRQRDEHFRILYEANPETDKTVEELVPQLTEVCPSLVRATTGIFLWRVRRVLVKEVVLKSANDLTLVVGSSPQLVDLLQMFVCRSERADFALTPGQMVIALRKELLHLQLRTLER